MSGSDPIKDLRHLMGDGMFSSSGKISEFCLSVGIFHGLASEAKHKIPRKWDPTCFDIWPLLQLIIHDMDPTIEDIKEMKERLYPFYLGGIEKVKKTIGDQRGKDALSSLSDLAPP